MGSVGAAAAAADLDHGEAEGAGVDGGDEAGRVGRDLGDGGGDAEVALEVFEEALGAAEGGDHAVEALGGGAGGEGVAELAGGVGGVGGEAGGGEELGAQRHGHVVEAGVDLVAAEEAGGVGDLERVAGGGGERLVHVGDERAGGAAGAGRDLDQRLGQGAGVVQGGHEGAGAGLDVEDEGVEAGGELLGEDRGGDEVDRLDRAGDVTDRIEAAVGGGDVGGLADDGAADVRDDAAEGLGVGLRGVAGDGVELVERAAGVAEAAAGDHRDEGAAGGERRSEDEADVVADAAGRVLVDDRAGEVPFQDRAAIAHGEREGDALVGVHAAEEDGHGEGGDLALGDGAGGEALDHLADFGGGEGAAVALAGDDLLREHQYPLPAVGASAPSRVARRAARTPEAPMRKRAGVAQPSPMRRSQRAR